MNAPAIAAAEAAPKSRFNVALRLSPIPVMLIPLSLFRLASPAMTPVSEADPNKGDGLRDGASMKIRAQGAASSPKQLRRPVTALDKVTGVIGKVPCVAITVKPPAAGVLEGFRETIFRTRIGLPADGRRASSRDCRTVGQRMGEHRGWPRRPSPSSDQPQRRRTR